ncbi:WhiB family transcriptional regulator [Actinospica durhamensis]
MDTMLPTRRPRTGRARPGGRRRTSAPRTLSTELAALDWQLEGACRELNEELFFGPPQTIEQRTERAARIREAKRVCARCPVSQRCLGYALENEEEFGVWGGLSELERWELLAERRARRG